MASKDAIENFKIGRKINRHLFNQIEKASAKGDVYLSSSVIFYGAKKQTLLLEALRFIPHFEQSVLVNGKTLANNNQLVEIVNANTKVVVVYNCQGIDLNNYIVNLNGLELAYNNVIYPTFIFCTKSIPKLVGASAKARYKLYKVISDDTPVHINVKRFK